MDPELRALLIEYLELPSADGSLKRRKIRNELRILLGIPTTKTGV